MRRIIKDGGVFVLAAAIFAMAAGIAYHVSQHVTWVTESNWPPRKTTVPFDATIPDVYGTGGPPMGLAIAWGLVLGGGALWFFRKFTPRTKSRPDVRPMEYSLASWVVLLRRGDHYDRVIAALMAEGSSSPASRRIAAERLSAAIQAEDIEDGFFFLPEKSPYPTRLARAARRWIENQVAKVAREAPGQGDACLVLFTSTDVAVEPVPLHADPARLVQAMRISNAGFPGDDAVMFVRHRLLDASSGRRAVEVLRQDVLVRARTV